MIKFKLLFWSFFLFTFQLSFSSAQNADVTGFIAGYQTENRLQFEKSYFIKNIAIEIPKNQLAVLNNMQPSKCFLRNYSSNDFQILIKGNSRYHAVEQEHLFTSCDNKGLINVPIYLQTEKFRL